MFTALAAAALLAVTSAATASPEEDAAHVVDAMHSAASRADGAAYFSTFAEDARFIGTDGTERWSLQDFRAYAEPYFAQGKGWTYSVADRHLEVLDQPCRCVAVFDEALDNASYGRVRGSGVLVKQGDGWKIQQYVLSFAVPNEKASAVVAVIGED